MNHLGRLERRKNARRVCRRTSLCQTLWGLDCPLLTVTDFSCPAKEREAKPVVIVTARVHPGESAASWMMQGLLDYVTSEVPRAIELRKAVVLKLVPMLNPDGVAVGNNRASLCGKDLNRCWDKPTELEQPTIHAVKELIRSLGKRATVYCDLHGHSKNHNVFMYGVGVKPSRRAAVSKFVKAVAANPLGQGIFCYKNCSFHVNASREGTARVVVARELGVSQSYTLEASFSGHLLTRTHFSIQHYHRMGQCLADSLVDHLDVPVASTRGNVRHRAMAILPCWVSLAHTVFAAEGAILWPWGTTSGVTSHKIIWDDYGSPQTVRQCQVARHTGQGWGSEAASCGQPQPHAWLACPWCLRICEGRDKAPSAWGCWLGTGRSCCDVITSGTHAHAHAGRGAHAGVERHARAGNSTERRTHKCCQQSNPGNPTAGWCRDNAAGEAHGCHIERPFQAHACDGETEARLDR